MLAFFHPDQLLHRPRTYMSRGAMRQPQEVPERVTHMLQAIQQLCFDIRAPADSTCSWRFMRIITWLF